MGIDGEEAPITEKEAQPVPREILLIDDDARQGSLTELITGLAQTAHPDFRVVHTIVNMQEARECLQDQGDHPLGEILPKGGIVMIDGNIADKTGQGKDGQELLGLLNQSPLVKQNPIVTVWTSRSDRPGEQLVDYEADINDPTAIMATFAQINNQRCLPQSTP